MTTGSVSGNGVPPEDQPQEAAEPSKRRFRRPSVSILTKLLIMLLGVGVVSAAVVGYVGYRNGSDSLRDAALDRMIEIRQSTTREVRGFYANLEASATLDSRHLSVIGAMRQFDAAYEELNEQGARPQDNATVRQFYEDWFVPEYEERMQRPIDIDVVLPKEPAAIYLQATYTTLNTDTNEKLLVDDAGDGSQWSAVHAQYHDRFRRTINAYNYLDAFLINLDGDIVYSAKKGTDLGYNVDSGQFAGGALAEAFNEARSAAAGDHAVFTDLVEYTPSRGAATGFVFSPIEDEGEVIGVLGFQIPITELNRIVTAGEDWQNNGLGETGETYLIGQDGLLRSNSRLLIEDPAAYRDAVVSTGTPPADADHAVHVGDATLIQPTVSSQAREALRGRFGGGEKNGYRGEETLGAWGPVDIPAQNWGIVAEIDLDEAYGPVRDFTRHLAIALGALVLAICIASLLLAQVFIRPVRRLLGGVQEVAAGKLDTQVPVTTRDEFGELGTAFNDMSRSLRTKAGLLAEQEAENTRMLLSLMPEDVARRYRDGEESIAAEHSDVTVVFADLVGFEEFTGGLSSEDSVELINALVRGFDEAADRLGVERVRTLHNGYLASCGLVVPRVDSARRAVDFALEMQHVVADFNAQHDARVVVRAGVNTGSVTSGLVGRQSLAYDMWGDTVNLAYKLPSTSPEPGIFVTQTVHERLRNQYEFTEAGTVDTGGGATPVWRLRGGES